MTLDDVLRDAVADFSVRGYDSEARLSEWVSRIRRAAEAALVPEREVDQQLRKTFGDIYRRLVERGDLMQSVPGASRFKLQQVKPKLREELNRSIFASASLIKLNKVRATEETIQRFAGWATSVPPGGSAAVKRRETVSATTKELRQLAFRARRVAIDQGAKFAANLSQILATEAGAIAAVWHQHFTRYPRHSHKLRDGKWYLLKNSWAREKGFVKPGEAGFYDDITPAGFEVFCRCTVTWYNSLGRLPPEMITEKGKLVLEEVRRRAVA